MYTTIGFSLRGGNLPDSLDPSGEIEGGVGFFATGDAKCGVIYYKPHGDHTRTISGRHRKLQTA